MTPTTVEWNNGVETTVLPSTCSPLCIHKLTSGLCSFPMWGSFPVTVNSIIGIREEYQGQGDGKQIGSAGRYLALGWVACLGNICIAISYHFPNGWCIICGSVAHGTEVNKTIGVTCQHGRASKACVYAVLDLNIYFSWFENQYIGV